MAQTDNVSPRHFMLPPNYDNLSFATTYNKKAELNRLNYIRVILYDQKKRRIPDCQSSCSAMLCSFDIRRRLRMAYLILPNDVLMLTPVISAISLNDKS